MTRRGARQREEHARALPRYELPEAHSITASADPDHGEITLQVTYQRPGWRGRLFGPKEVLSSSVRTTGLSIAQVEAQVREQRNRLAGSIASFHLLYATRNEDLGDLLDGRAMPALPPGHRFWVEFPRKRPDCIVLHLSSPRDRFSILRWVPPAHDLPRMLHAAMTRLADDAARVHGLDAIADAARSLPGRR